jgi:hypothetical protein
MATIQTKKRFKICLSIAISINEVNLFSYKLKFPNYAVTNTISLRPINFICKFTIQIQPTC